MKLGANEANTVKPIRTTGKFDERNSTCGTLFPAFTFLLASNSLVHPLSVLLSFLISLFSFPLALSLWVSLSLSHFVVLVAIFPRIMSRIRGFFQR